MVPSAFVAPIAAVVGDRYRRERILLVVHLIRAAACPALLPLSPSEPILVVYELAVLAAVPLAAHRPCLALAPMLARTPRGSRPRMLLR